MRSIVRRGAFIAFLVIGIASRGLAHADDLPSPQPILFYQVSQGGEYHGAAGAETVDHSVQAMLHDRLMPALATALGTTLDDVNLGDPRDGQIAEACRAHRAVGAVALDDSWFSNRSGKSQSELRVTLRNCSETIWVSLEGVSVVESAKESVLDDMTAEVIGQVIDKVRRLVHDTPNATANFVRYGFYMNDAEADSFWTVAVEKGKTNVDYCDPVGTAYRAGLRVGDEVTAIDGVATQGVDQAQLNAILENAKRKGPWVLAVRASDGATRELSFRNEPVSWYVAHTVP